MSRARNRLIAAVLAVGAVVLANIVIAYKVQPIHACPGSYDYICLAPRQIISLGQADIDPAPGSDLARYHGKILGDRGLYSRFDVPETAAVIAGILLPILLLVAAAALFVRPPHSKTSTVS